MRNSPKRRRGVLLLVVLGMLAMFAMVGLTFVMLTGQARRIAEVGRSVDVQFVSPRDDLDRAMAQVARGSNNPMSAIGPHGLLEDLYGPDTRTGGRISSASDIYLLPGTNGPVLEIASTGISSPQQCGGRVLTMLNGPAAGTSARILAYLPAGGSRPRGRFQVLPNEKLDYTQIYNHFRNRGPQINYIVNGAEFSGRGLGIDTSNGTVDDRSLLPGLHGVGGWSVVTGEANEDYDAPDHQNMLLAMVMPPNQSPVPVVVPSLHRPDLVRYWASRRGSSAGELRNYILRPLQKTADGKTQIHSTFTGSNPRGQRALSLLLNPSTDPAGVDSYPWDVDNDGDGLVDSVWVDLGMSVRSTPDGRLYKPLFAILCTDLDGRLNLNAHGCIAQLNSNYYQQSRAAEAWLQNPNITNTRARFASMTGAVPGSGMESAALPRGLGYGPAEVNLRALFDSSSPTGTAIPDDLRYLLYGRNVPNVGLLDGRYGEGPNYNPRPGFYNNRTPFTYLLWNRDYAYACNYNPQVLSSTPTAMDAYGTPPDLDGLASIGLDVAGRPIYWGMGDRGVLVPGSRTDLKAINSPYEINLFHEGAWRTNRSPRRTIDNPFTLAELERLLRPNDIDAGTLPARLLLLTSNRTGNPATSSLLRRAAELTTDSWDLPCPPVVMPPELRRLANHYGPAYHLLYVLQRKMALNGAALTGDELLRRARHLLPSEMLSGLRLNLNPPLGNGRDDNGNNVVDEAEEASPGDFLTAYNQTGGLISNSTSGPVRMDLSNGLALDTDSTTSAGSGSDRVLARQFFARNLYVLALLVCDPRAFDDPRAPTVAPRMKRMLAQWAVNVVDFYDRDSIMTRFDYDTDPFDTSGWNPPGHDRDWLQGGIVYGCERPELLLTESLAFHDRRTEDLDSETIMRGDPPEKAAKTDDPNEPDLDFDQRVRPQGSLFFELFNPWSRYDAPTGEIHVIKNAVPAVDLARRNPEKLPDGTLAPSRHPVWQVLVTKREFKPEKADTPDPEMATDPSYDPREWKAERAIYFANPSGLPDAADCDARVRYYCSATPSGTGATALTGHERAVPAGEYAVVGPGRSGTTEAHTYLGAQTDGTFGPDARQIVLRPYADPAQNERRVEVVNNVAPPETDPPSTRERIQPPVAIIVDQSNRTLGDEPHRMNISEPAGGYDQDSQLPTWDADVQGYVYPSVQTVPADMTRADDGESDLTDAVTRKDIEPGIRVLHLRRLANPLRPYDGRLWIGTKRNPEYNPYRTIDSLPVDLIAFNGMAPHHALELGEGVTPALNEVLDSRERGEHPVVSPTNPTDIELNVWRQEPWDMESGIALTAMRSKLAGRPKADGQNYDKPFYHTLGYLNSWYGEVPARPNDEFHRGDPLRPFPWLVWNNRPFISPYELLYVPGTVAAGPRCYATSSDRLLRHNDFGPYFRDTNHFQPSTTADNVRRNWPYKHLQDFFESLPYPSDTLTAGMSRPAALYRLLDCVGVPSRYAGTSIQLDPRYLGGNPPYSVEHYFHPPYNWVSAYREPGRVNINTIYSYDVFRALMNNTAMPVAEMQALWSRVIRSRRGDARSSTGSFLNDMLTINSSVPSRFGNPFRSYAGGSLRHESVRVALNGNGQDAEVHATLLRADPDTGASGGTLRPLFRNVSNDLHTGSYENAYFRFQNYTRLANKITTRSNVYAVWITVGYFQVRAKSNPDTSVHPDGWELGQELGMDSGEVQRHRAFYIFDRSIPVGFMRGQDLNFEKALRVRRYIE